MTEFHLRKNTKAAVEKGWSGSRELGANCGKTGSHRLPGSAFSRLENLKFILEIERRVKPFMDLEFSSVFALLFPVQDNIFNTQ